MLGKMTSQSFAANISSPVVVSPFDQRQFDFVGKHLLATYRQCNVERLLDLGGLLEEFRAGIHDSGAIILGESVQTFPNGGITAVFLLAESHASIHTYPEHAGCFIDMFTCGLECNPGAIEPRLSTFLETRQAESRIILRGDAFSSET